MKFALAARRDAERYKPMAILWIGVVATLMFFLVMGLMVWSGFEELVTAENRESRFDDLLQEIILADEQRGNFIRTAAAEQDTGWTARYQINRLRLHGAVALAATIEDAVALRTDLRSLRDTYAALLRVEDEVLRLAASGQNQAALSLLVAPSYLENERNFAAVVSRLSSGLEAYEADIHRSFRRRLLFTGANAAAFMIAFAIGWTAVLRIMGRSLARRRRAERDLKESEEKYRTLLEALPHGVLILRQHRVVFANPAGVTMFGYRTAAELIGADTANLIPDRERDRLFLYEEMACEGKGALPDCITTALRRVTQEEFPVEVHARPVNYGGAPGVQMVLLDITDRERTEAALRESEERFRSLADSAPVMIWMAGVRRHAFYFNKTWLTFTGSRLSQQYGQGWAEHVHPDDLPRCRELYQSAFDARRPFTNEYRLRHVDGLYHWVLETGVPRVSPDGSFTGYVGTCIDITDRYQAEAALRESERKFHDLSDLLPQPVFETDATGRLTFVNQRALELFGYTRQDFDRGQMAIDMVVPADRARAADNFRRILTGERLSSREYMARRRDGSQFPVLIDSVRFVEEGRVCGVRGIIIDMTELKGVQSQLEHKRAELETLFQALPDVCLRLAPDLTVLDLHAGAAAQLVTVPGCSAPAPLSAVLPAPLCESLREAMRDLDGGRLTVERPLTLHGVPRWVEVRLVPFQRGETIALLRDISERRRAEDALDENRRVFTTLLSNLPGMAYRCRNDRDWTMEFVSDGAYALCGYRPAELVGNRRISWAGLTHPDDREMVRERVQEALAGRQPFRVTYRIVTPSGDTKRVWEQGRGVFDPDGRLTALEGYISDLTAHPVPAGSAAHTAVLRELIESVARVIQAGAAAEDGAPAAAEIQALIRQLQDRLERLPQRLDLPAA